MQYEAYSHAAEHLENNAGNLSSFEHHLRHHNRTHDDVYQHRRYRHRFHFKDRRKKRTFCCVNCGKEGHVYKQCTEPITSFGIIAMRRKPSGNVDRSACSSQDQQQQHRYKCETHSRVCPDTVPSVDATIGSYPLYLMVQRKDTIGFIDFIRGKYPEHDVREKMRILKTYLGEMTCEERFKLATESFENLWDMLWINKLSMLYINEYVEAKEKFSKLDVHSLLAETECHWTEQEYGFPKGRKNMFENNIECAKREFREESGYTTDQIHILSEKPWEEIFTGTNGIRYRHVYYIAEILPHVDRPKIPLSDVKQAGEISNVAWFTYEQCVRVIRPYDTAKKELITQIHTRFGRGLDKRDAN